MEHEEQELLKRTIEKDLDNLLDKINSPLGLRRSLMVLLNRLSKNKNKDSFDDLITNIQGLQKKLTNSEDIQFAEGEVIKLEASYRRIVLIPSILSAIIYVLLGIGVFFILKYFEKEELMTKVGYYKYFGVGFAGTVLYYTIKPLKKKERQDRTKLLVARLITTFLVCFILVLTIDLEPGNVFKTPQFSKDGPNILAFFVVGYSIEIVISLLNKLVEKVKGMIDSI